MKRLTSLLLATFMLLTGISASAEALTPPATTTEDILVFLAESLEEVICGEQDGLNVTFTTPDGEVYSGGFGMRTADSGMATTILSSHYSAPEYALALAQGNLCLTDTQGSISVPILNLLSAGVEAATGTDFLSALSGLDFTSLAPIGQDLLTRLMSCDGISYAFSDQMLTLHVDLDKVLQHIDAVIPAVLLHHAAELNALFEQLAPFLGMKITTAQLQELWASLHLPSIVTNLALDMVLFQTGDTLTLMASAQGGTLKAELSPAHLSLTLTEPSGTVYAFDTMDILTLADIVSTVPNCVTPEAIQYEQSIDSSKRRPVITTNIAVDFTLLERDIKAGLIKAISANQLTLDALCDKYRPLIKLLLGHGNIRSSTLLTMINSAAGLLPDWTGAITIVQDQYNYMLDITAHLAEDGEAFALFDLHNDNASLNATLRDAYGTFAMNLTGAFDRRSNTLTFSCTEDLGGFHSITYATGYHNSYYAPYTSITTDTDIFHYFEDSYGFDLKIYDYSANCHLGRNYDALRFRWPDGFLDYTSSDVGFDIISNFGSLSARDTYDIAKINGTIMDGHTPTHFFLLFDSENSLLTASVMPYRSTATHLRYQPGRLSILADESELVIADAHSVVPGQNITTITFDNEPLATLVSTLENDDLTVCAYPGASTSGSCWTLHFDFDVPGTPLPADAVTVTAEEFIRRLSALTAPVPTQPPQQ